MTPALRLADGAETALDPVTIKPQEVKSIDLDAAIAAAAAPQLIGTYGSVVLRYRSPYAATLYAAMMVRRMGHAIAFHMDALGESQDLQVGSREGIWWLPKDTTSDYLILTNQGKNTLPLDLLLYDASGKQAKQKVLLGPAETARYSIRKLILASGLTGSYGGIKISTSAHAGSLASLHFLFDEAAGFSAILKMFDYNPNAKPEERDYARTATWTLRAPMLALTNPDPALAFPPGTTLLPQLLLRNTTAKPIDATLRFNWRTAASTGKAPGPAVRLAPYETRRIDVAALQDASILPKEANWTSVTITTNSKPDELMAVAASYDSTLRYGAQTPFSDQLTYRWEGGMWEYDPYHSSIITAGNGGTKPTQAAFTIFYNQGTQRYDLEQALQPDEQMWIDVGKLIREQVPDKNGKALPADLTSGSYEFRDLINTGVGTLFEGKVIYDKTYGHVAYGCAACCGYDFLSAAFAYDPLGVPIGGLAGQAVMAPDECQGGALADVSDIFWGAWGTASSSIATVDTHGTHTGVSVGSTTSQTHGCLNSNDSLRNCPLKCTYPSGNDNVHGLTISGAQSIMDGQQGAFSVSVSGGTATAYSWSFTAPSGAGNGPNVSFTAPTSAQTNTDGHWFALPNVACPSQSDLPGYYNSVYTIKATVTFSEGDTPSKSTTLTVNSYWNPAGLTDPNIARIGGVPNMASDNPDGSGTWRVTGKGTLSRVVPTSSTINVISTSQFYSKTVQHEQVHVNNWIAGTGHLYGDLYNPDDFYNQIINITGTSQNDLINKLSAALTTYVNSQGAIVAQRHSQDEQQAYAVSDPIAPQYVYQNCGRY